LHKEWHVERHIVLAQGPEIVASPDWIFLLDVFPQLPQNITTEVSVQSVLMEQNPPPPKKKQLI
jgi:hypothetical protein